MSDQLREQLQAIADREMRTLSNQMVFFLQNSVGEYLFENMLDFNPEKGLIPTEVPGYDLPDPLDPGFPDSEPEQSL